VKKKKKAVAAETVGASNTKNNTETLVGE